MLGTLGCGLFQNAIAYPLLFYDTDTERPTVYQLHN